MNEDPVYVVFVTCPDRDEAARIGRALVEEDLAACVNILGEIQSIYRWEDQICDDPEVLCIIKTTAARFAALRDRVQALHPYQIPEVIALPVTAGHAPYLAWVRESVGG